MAEADKNEVLGVTKAELALAFNKWRDDFNAHPKTFGNVNDPNYGEVRADYLMKLVREVRTCLS